MNWALYLPIGGAIALALAAVGSVPLEDVRSVRFIVMMVFWPLVLLGLAWHGLTVLRWKHRHRNR